VLSIDHPLEYYYKLIITKSLQSVSESHIFRLECAYCICVSFTNNIIKGLFKDYKLICILCSSAHWTNVRVKIPLSYALFVKDVHTICGVPGCNLFKTDGTVILWFMPLTILRTFTFRSRECQSCTFIHPNISRILLLILSGLNVPSMMWTPFFFLM